MAWQHTKSETTNIPFTSEPHVYVDPERHGRRPSQGFPPDAGRPQPFARKLMETSGRHFPVLQKAPYTADDNPKYLSVGVDVPETTTDPYQTVEGSGEHAQ